MLRKHTAISFPTSAPLYTPKRESSGTFELKCIVNILNTNLAISNDVWLTTN